MTKLIPFDLEAAKAGAPVMTRDGRPARIVCFNLNNEQPLIAVISGDGYEWSDQFSVDGSFMSSASEHKADLFMAAKRIKKWRVVYRDVNSAAHKDFIERKEAFKFISDTCGIDNATYPFEIEVSE